MTINQQTQSEFESVVAPARDRGDAGHINVASSERWLSLLLGSSLLLLGAARPKTRVPWVLASGVLLFRGATGRCPLYDLLGINTTNAYPHPATSVPHQRGIRVEDSIQINKPADELYRFWRSFENLPRFMTQHVAVERCDGDTRSHWRVKSVGGTTFEWDAEIINDIPNELLAWRSLPGADLDHAGSVRFEKASSERAGTTVRVVWENWIPACAGMTARQGDSL